MAKYTVELREIVKSGAKVFDFPYVFYNESKKAEFEQRFINHFYFREIGMETVGRFQHYLRCKCDEVLPYYNMLFKTAEFDYDLINNYNLTETFEKTSGNQKTTTGNTTQNTDTTDNSHLNGVNTINRDVISTGSKTSELDSTTNHNQDINLNRDETNNETSSIDNNSSVNVDNKKVESDTPNGLLSMQDIKDNVYASRVEIQDGNTTTEELQNSNIDKENKITETTATTSKDIVDATSRDTLNDTTNEDTITSTNNTTTNTGSIDTTSTANQTENGNSTENYILTRIGNIGVDKPSDMLQKHIEFQKIMTTIYTQFFNECEDLFMQIY